MNLSRKDPAGFGKYHIPVRAYKAAEFFFIQEGATLCLIQMNDSASFLVYNIIT